MSLAGVAGLRMQIANPLRDTAFIGIGIGIASTVAPETTAAMLRWPLAFVVMAGMAIAAFDKRFAGSKRCFFLCAGRAAKQKGAKSEQN